MGAIESWPDTGTVGLAKLTRQRRLALSGGSDIDLFGYGKSIINLDA
jgi:hypothetical protein